MDLTNLVVLVCLAVVAILVVAYIFSNSRNKNNATAANNQIPAKNLASTALLSIFVAIDVFVGLFHLAPYYFQSLNPADRSGTWGLVFLLYSPLLFVLFSLFGLLIGLLVYFTVKQWFQKAAPAILIIVLILNLVVLIVTQGAKF